MKQQTRNRNAIGRVNRLLNRERLVFVCVGPRVGTDRAIPQYVERHDGATVGNKEYNALLRRIVAAAKDGAP